MTERVKIIRQLQNLKGENMFKNLFRMDAPTDKTINEEGARWRGELNTAISNLENDDMPYPSYEEKIWFYEQFYLFITDRTMAHPNPGIREDQEYNWTHPDIIRINNDRDWFHSSHSDDLTCRLNHCKDLYVQGEISVDEYCKERENIQKEDNNFRWHFRL